MTYLDLTLHSLLVPIQATLPCNIHVPCQNRRPVQKQNLAMDCLLFPNFQLSLSVYFYPLPHEMICTYAFSLTPSYGTNKYEYLFPLVLYHCGVGFQSLQTIPLRAADPIRPMSFIFFVVQVHSSLGSRLVLRTRTSSCAFPPRRSILVSLSYLLA